MTPLRRSRGRIAYLGETGDTWGFEDWSITCGDDGMRVLQAHCELEFGGQRVVRDSVQSVHADFAPHDAYVRLMVDGAFRGSAWFLAREGAMLCESFTTAEGRLSQRLPLQPPVRGFVTHSLQGDAWLTPAYDRRGSRNPQFFPSNPLCSSHHLGATGPFIMTTRSGLEYCGCESVDVKAGSFTCDHFRIVQPSNDHPPYDLWVTSDGEAIFVLAQVAGYMASRFELIELAR